MSGFFSLGGGYGITKDHHSQQQQRNIENQTQEEQEGSIITPKSLYLFKNEEIYNKGFDLWQQYYQLHQQREHYDLCLNNNSNTSTNTNTNSNGLYAGSWNFVRSSEASKMMRASGYGIDGGDTVNSGINCQDCGNQAKKDCQHMRCRTCCKSRGFQCQTHVKSTWVPAAKRRERQLASLTPTQQQHYHHNLGHQQLSLMMRGGASGGTGGEGGGGIDNNAKRLREDHHNLGSAVALHLPATQGLEVGYFPAEVNSPAVFRCVRVTAIDEGEEQLAYQTAVNIGGHVYKGILYDHGPEGRYNHPSGGDSSSAGVGTSSQHQQLNLITSGNMGVATDTVNANVTSVDQSSIYPTPLNAFMAGTQFFPPPRS